MAKSRTETSLPLIVSLVFSVLLAIGLGVFTYVLYSDQAAKDAAVKKATDDLKNAREGEKDARQIALVHRIFTGLDEGDDLKDLAEVKEGTKAFQELQRLNKLATKRAAESAKVTGDKFNAALAAYYADLARRDPTPPKLDTSALNIADDMVFWPGELDANKVLKPPPAAYAGGGSPGSMIDLVARSRVARDLAVRQAADDRAAYANALSLINAAVGDYKKAKAGFDTAAGKFTTDLDAKITALEKLSNARLKKYDDDVLDRNKEVEKLNNEIAELKLQLRRKDEQIANVKGERDAVIAKSPKVDPFQFDEPQGKITRRPEADIVEIDLGSDDKVQPGLTFTVLPSDFPEKGRQSRMREFREKDERGNFRSVQRFVPKATIEVVTVLGPKSSRARVTSEYDNIRERALPGDLLYNSVWRKGQADHVALVGIFDINGDGTDDIESVVRDLTRMGIPVDAYYDLRTQKWVGRLTERTRYLVEGYTPANSANDPNRDAKTKLIGGMSAAKAEAENRRINVVSFRDFFPRMGYKFRIDVPEDRINQAMSRYLVGVGTSDMPPPEPK